MLKILMLKKVGFLLVIILFTGLCAISNLFAMEPEKQVNTKEVCSKEFGEKNELDANKKWPRIDFYCNGDEKEINAVARIEPDLFVRSIVVQVSKILKSGEFKSTIYARGRSGVLLLLTKGDCPEIVKNLKIVERLKEKIEALEKERLEEAKFEKIK